MKKRTIFTLTLVLHLMFFSCSNMDEEDPDVSGKDLVKVSIRSLSILQSAPISGRTAAVPDAIEYIDVIYGPYPDMIDEDPFAPSDRVLTTFAVDDFPDDYTVELEKGKDYYIGIAAYSLIPNPDDSPAYSINYLVSTSQPVFLSTVLRLKHDFFAFSEIFTADSDMDIDAELKRISSQLKLKMPEGVSLPASAKKGQITIRDTSVDRIGGIYLDLIDPGDVSDDLTFEFNLDLTTDTGIDSVFHTMPLSDSAPGLGTTPLEINVKLLNELDDIIAEGSTELDTIRFNRCYNLILDPNLVGASISVDVDETIEEEVDIIVD